MPNPSRRSCQVPGCDLGPPDDNGIRGPYVTHEENATKAEVKEDLESHVEMAHKIPLQQTQTNTKQVEASTQQIQAKTKETEAETRRLLIERGTDVQDAPVTESTAQRRFQEKRDSIPRPTIEENSTESDFSFFQAQWGRYVANTYMSENQQMHKLWAACSQSLQHQLHYGGSAKCTTITQLFNAIKRLAVNRRNNLVNIVEFQRMGQNKDETIMAFSTRLNGQADVCDMFVPCHNQECSADVSYKEDMITYQFLRGLSDTNIQEKIMEAAATSEGQKMSLSKALKIAEAYELGKTSQQLVNNGGELSRISQYQQNKRE